MGPAADIMGGDGMTPGAAVKFLRTGTSSANFFLLHELNALPDMNHNLFAVPLRNHLPDNVNSIAGTIGIKRFCTTGHCPTKVGLSNVCTHDQDGNEAEELVFPFMITFDKTGDIDFNEAMPSSFEEFMAQYKACGSNVQLFSNF